jgi:hypothetical protein
MVLVKPATVDQWHRQGFRLFWRWRSRPGRPSLNREVRDLIRQMNLANPLWGAPRIHGELLKLGIEISQATVAKYVMRRRGRPSPTWRSFLRNQAACTRHSVIFRPCSSRNNTTTPWSNLPPENCPTDGVHSTGAQLSFLTSFSAPFFHRFGER